MKLFLEIQAPHRWALIRSKNQLQDQGVLNSLDNYKVPKRASQVIGVAPGEAIACHSIQIPGKRKTHIESALPYALEDRLSQDVEDLHFKLLSWQLDKLALAAVVSESDLNGWIQKFRRHNIEFDAIVAEYFLLPMPPKGDVIISKMDEQRICIRSGQHQGLLLDADNFDYWWQAVEKQNLKYSITDLNFAKLLIERDKQQNPDQPIDYISHWDIGKHFTQWIAKSDFSEAFQEISLLSGKFTPRHHSNGSGLIRLAVMIGVLAVIGYWGGLKYEQLQLTQQKQSINNELRQIFADQFPNEPYLDRPKSQLTNILNRLQNGQTSNSEFKFFMTSVSEVSPQFNATVEEVNYADQEMIILFTVQNLSSLDKIKGAFNNLNGVVAELLSSGVRDNKVNGRFRINRRS